MNGVLQFWGHPQPLEASKALPSGPGVSSGIRDYQTYCWRLRKPVPRAASTLGAGRCTGGADWCCTTVLHQALSSRLRVPLHISRRMREG
jgi:hypothetical protein